MAIASLEDVFVREFKSAVNINTIKDIYNLPLPPIVNSWEVSGTDVLAVKGITGPFSALNKTLVKKLPNDIAAKRRVIDKVTRGFKRNEDNSFVYEDYKKPSGSIIVTSNRDINLSYEDYIKPPEGYGYIDFKGNRNNPTYLYALPKEVLYKVNQTALALSVKAMSSFNGYGYTTWNMGKIYLCVVPYKPGAKYVETKILKTGYTLNYSREIKAISDYWESIGLIPDISLCALQSGENLCLSHVNVGYNDYSPVAQLPLSTKEIFGEED